MQGAGRDSRGVALTPVSTAMCNAPVWGPEPKVEGRGSPRGVGNKSQAH